MVTKKLKYHFSAVLILLPCDSEHRLLMHHDSEHYLRRTESSLGLSTPESIARGETLFGFKEATEVSLVAF